jgi:hypothetical protein
MWCKSGASVARQVQRPAPIWVCKNFAAGEIVINTVCCKYSNIGMKCGIPLSRNNIFQGRYLQMLKKMRTVSMMAAIAALALASQTFAFGGGMGGGQMGGGYTGGSMGGSHQMSSGMNGTSGAGMHQGQMNGTGAQYTAMNGTGAQSTMQGGAGNTANMQNRQTGGSGVTTMQAPATTTTK